MKRVTIHAAMLAAAFAAAAPSPAAAQDVPGDSVDVVIVYGDDPCPASADAKRIVVCPRLDEGERYRIPPNLRESDDPANEPWTNRVKSMETVGNFGTMLHAIGKDPAMLIYLDGAASRKGKPNENFAREVMELFTLGEGHYTEQDIKEAARTYTGWSIDREHDFAYIWRPQIHDTGVKTVFGQSGDYDGDQMLDILLSRPETANFIVTKLWHEFVSPDVDVAQAQRVADAFRASGYDI